MPNRPVALVIINYTAIFVIANILQIRVLRTATPGFVDRVFQGVGLQLGMRSSGQINAELVAQLQQVQEDVCRLGAHFGALGFGQVAALVFGQPLKVLQ